MEYNLREHQFPRSNVNNNCDMSKEARRYRAVETISN